MKCMVMVCSIHLLLINMAEASNETKFQKLLVLFYAGEILFLSKQVGPFRPYSDQTSFLRNPIFHLFICLWERQQGLVPLLSAGAPWVEEPLEIVSYFILCILEMSPYHSNF